jgi:Na+/H+-dicarboxylate symporter/ABC-type amino acid transport substrate-binding protein
VDEHLSAPAGSQPGGKLRTGGPLSPFQRILLALLAGIATGIFLGEIAAPLRVVGDIYVGLLQMTVLPFIICSVIGNIGSLTIDQSKRLALIGFAVLFVLWVVGFGTLALLASALPELPSGSFFSTSLVEPPREFDFVEIFVPSNPFRSLSENFVPAVVVFCILVGFALMQSPNKNEIVNLFKTLNEALGRVSNYVTRLSPIGVFAIAASAAGTITLEEFGRLQAYFVIYGTAVLLLVFILLPLIVSAVTPFRYFDIIATQGNVLITALAIGSVFAVIPLLVESQKRLVDRLGTTTSRPSRGELEQAADFVIPLAYPFPHLGKIVTLIFIPFAAWFYGRPMEAMDYASFMASGLFLSFGKVTVTIPFLLDLQEVPTDIFRLFLMSSAVAGPLSDMLGAAHLLAFTSLTTCAMSGLLVLKRFRIAGVAAICTAITIATIGVTHLTLTRLFGDLFSRENVIAQMNLIQEHSAFVILPVSEPNSISLLPGESPMERIERRGRIRVGFDPDNLPFSYYNARGELVGHDIDLAHRLGKDFGLELEFVPINVLTLVDQLREDHFDIAASGIAVNIGAYEDATYSQPYLNVNLAFVAADHRRSDFSSMAALGTGQGFVLGIKKGSYFQRYIREILPDARIVELWSESQFFEGPPERMDALVTTAEGGSAWTLIHPEFAVIDPRDNETSASIAFLFARADTQIGADIGTWLQLKRNDGTLRRLYEYWILGRGAKPTARRWSVVRDVLSWTD